MFYNLFSITLLTWLYSAGIARNYWKIIKESISKKFERSNIDGRIWGFDALNHDLLIIAKLKVYAFQHDGMKTIYIYLTKRTYRTKVDTNFSYWEELTQRVFKGFVFGPLLLDIYLNDLFYFSKYTEECNFAADTAFDGSYKELRSFLLIDWNMTVS